MSKRQAMLAGHRVDKKKQRGKQRQHQQAITEDAGSISVTWTIGIRTSPINKTHNFEVYSNYNKLLVHVLIYIQSVFLVMKLLKTIDKQKPTLT